MPQPRTMKKRGLNKKGGGKMKMTFQGKNNAESIAKAGQILGGKFVSKELFKGPPNNHKFKPGDLVELYGLEDYPEFNGEIVEISSIREDGTHGKAYYFETSNTELAVQLNWIYEYRLRKYRP